MYNKSIKLRQQKTLAWTGQKAPPFIVDVTKKDKMMEWNIHNKEYFLKHCEIVSFLISRKDRDHPAVKHHIRAAIREASNHVGFAPGNAKNSARYISNEAVMALNVGKIDNLIAEHVVPVSEINKILLNKEATDITDIANIILKYGVRAVITKEEDLKLNSLGLNKSMPVALTENTIMSRYEAAEITVIDNCYSKLLRQ